ncbi:MAG: CbbQ/NirQ/NorQ/GpvN family protein [Candidatus Abyssobacteria bacterium SURF_17]|uniref:CbbQ/NirQ/NorQ/GpvN family protein n=1 Tax=Candidatus Abyssobacteria bacterium SURF_17 TaxID=2093361 RepID=A0A419EXH2_9BACT|nr:MAG: CbbQ/NirQ/NorQ/GpvN family protein [Candidatus Abyssubacteria bacterium SURF_17]
MERLGGVERFFEEHYFTEQPYYLPIRDEVEVFRAAFSERLPVLLKGPTGCGKTRFIEYMAYTLQQERIKQGIESPDTATSPLITVACHEDLSASDLVGRYLLKDEETVWIDGPLTRAVKIGAICYLDEIVEARKDTTVLIHPLADYRRILPIEKKGQMIHAHENFLLVISYNPGYQSVLKNLKHSTRQRFVAIDFDYPPREAEARIIVHESGIDMRAADQLALLGEKVRHLREHGLEEGVSTRLLIYAGKLMVSGITPRRACELAVAKSITDDRELEQVVTEITRSIFES